MEGVEKIKGMTNIYFYVTRLYTRELSKTRMDVEAVMTVITTREMVGEVEMGVNNVLGMVRSKLSLAENL